MPCCAGPHRRCRAREAAPPPSPVRPQVWQCTALMQAAKDGGVAILDGVDKLKPGCLAYLQRLLVDGEVCRACPAWAPARG